MDLCRRSAAYGMSLVWLGFLAGCSERTFTSHAVSGPLANFDSTSSVYYHLPRGVIPISIKPHQNKANLLEITQGATIYLPDRRAKYRLERHENAFSEDKLTVSVDEFGLLAGLNSDVADRSPQIVQKIVEIAANVAKAASAEALTATPKGTEPQSCRVEALIDPFSSVSLAAANEALQKCQLTLTVSYPGEGVFDTPKDKRAQAALDAETATLAARCDGSICFRPVTPVAIRLRGDGNVDATFVAAVPDIRSVFAYDVTRGPCIERVGALEITRGMMKKADLKKPSEVEGCLEIPLRVAKAAASIPGEVLTVRVQQAESEAKLLEAEREIIAAQQSLLQASQAAGR